MQFLLRFFAAALRTAFFQAEMQENLKIPLRFVKTICKIRLTRMLFCDIIIMYYCISHADLPAAPATGNDRSTGLRR